MKCETCHYRQQTFDGSKQFYCSQFWRMLPDCWFENCHQGVGYKLATLSSMVKQLAREENGMSDLCDTLSNAVNILAKEEAA